GQLPVREAAAVFLLARGYRGRAPAPLIEPYLEYARAGRTRSRMNRMRRKRVRLSPSEARGRHFDLEKMFEELNRQFFAGQLQKPHIGWSTRSWWRQFGCYDPGTNQILLNRGLDHPGVAQCVVEYVLYHAMMY